MLQYILVSEDIMKVWTIVTVDSLVVIGLASVYLFQTCEWNEDSNYVCIIFVCTQYLQIISKCFVFRWCWSRQQWEWKWNCTIIRHSNNWWAIPTQVFIFPSNGLFYIVNHYSTFLHFRWSPCNYNQP